ncbi:DUF397 domain-containing protein [Streptomyces sp. UH6]|uniref:DUF397 domain-containing protein n=1 Tax=Streptomyces sp. UH6 TaxID=2748379 RepID=UPI0015D46E5B|nr:DUF397 domain-containing protein [Streptomyces sp. UH6]NYV73676.1 DUF397 domain-containing protein [Streptomyces sp. UH6]
MENVTLVWRKSSVCGNGDSCFELAFSGRVWVRNSGFPDSATVAFSRRTWLAFVKFVKDAEAADEAAGEPV